ncbi:chlororespiratory reduction protein 7 [Cronbergia sp. UHCC 0137]|uniref:chlororespiratory reduction protein 7 n=1 Tax=Cronbergia sp. UHCC 0137 TaxID=3110239 RepID=UPI002B1ED177|nr:chlororespiratory reduction protein 7 [Cronbergia sp. UHCC 0137]MEA5620035.1 chlororespiratory reduction protein 7 [Cronbergia sp. UHCC 0137]
MPDPLMYQQDNFVVLEANQAEQFLTTAELLEKLQNILQHKQLEDLPPDVQKFASVADQAQYLLNTSCELDIEPGHYFQWYAVRLEK